jgi:2-polyprenyl-3-methyl-5-hydroxy-6-metoxy-1,4-benzoquinol methylase
MPGRVNAAVTPGHYARKQLLSRSGLVAWSHTSRFELARRLVEPRAGGRLLDYGCGDGTFLARVADLFPSALGVDAAADQIEDCARRFAGVGGVRFAPADALAGDEHTAAYDVVVCMEVLEHCPEDLQGGVLDTMRRAAAPGGLVVISVPIEIGPSLIAKQAARALAAFRGLREYAQRERYRPDELVRMVFAGAGTRIPRPETTASLEDGSTMRFTGHKGFNWKRLAVEIAARFHVDAVRFSPMPLCGALLNSQVWFVGTPREEGADDECCRVNPDCQMANGEVSERTIPRRNP